MTYILYAWTEALHDKDEGKGKVPDRAVFYPNGTCAKGIRDFTAFTGNTEKNRHHPFRFDAP